MAHSLEMPPLRPDTTTKLANGYTPVMRVLGLYGITSSQLSRDGDDTGVMDRRNSFDPSPLFTIKKLSPW